MIGAIINISFFFLFFFLELQQRIFEDLYDVFVQRRKCNLFNIFDLFLAKIFNGTKVCFSSDIVYFLIKYLSPVRSFAIK